VVHRKDRKNLPAGRTRPKHQTTTSFLVYRQVLSHGQNLKWWIRRYRLPCIIIRKKKFKKEVEEIKEDREMVLKTYVSEINI